MSRPTLYAVGLAIFIVVGNVAWYYSNGAGKQSHEIDPAIGELRQQWEALSKRLAAVPVVRQRFSDGQARPDFKPLVGARYEYVRTLQSQGANTLAVARGEISFSATEDRSLVASHADHERWQLDGEVLHSTDLTRHKGPVEDFWETSPERVNHSPFAFMTSTPRLGCDLIKGMPALLALGANSDAGSAKHEAFELRPIGIAKVGPFTTVEVDAERDASRHLAKMARHGNRASVPLGMTDLSCQESAKLFLDLETGLLVRCETCVTMKPANSLGSGRTLKAIYQVFALQ